ncbi:MAG: hypothetical protein E7280_03995 [Lachnospiraceae bacterium]|nr:hypothetical protein [Lachnospiraceae bacterium]
MMKKVVVSVGGLVLTTCMLILMAVPIQSKAATTDKMFSICCERLKEINDKYQTDICLTCRDDAYDVKQYDEEIKFYASLTSEEFEEYIIKLDQKGKKLQFEMAINDFSQTAEKENGIGDDAGFGLCGYQPVLIKVIQKHYYNRDNKNYVFIVTRCTEDPRKYVELLEYGTNSVPQGYPFCTLVASGNQLDYAFDSKGKHCQTTFYCDVHLSETLSTKGTVKNTFYINDR